MTAAPRSIVTTSSCSRQREIITHDTEASQSVAGEVAMGPPDAVGNDILQSDHPITSRRDPLAAVMGLFKGVSAGLDRPRATNCRSGMMQTCAPESATTSFMATERPLFSPPLPIRWKDTETLGWSPDAEDLQTLSPDMDEEFGEEGGV